MDTSLHVLVRFLFYDAARGTRHLANRKVNTANASTLTEEVKDVRKKEEIDRKK